MAPDPKPARTVRDRKAKRDFRRQGALTGTCAVCGVSTGLTIHHVFDRDDVHANFVFLCGSGTTGCHGEVTNENPIARAKLGAHIVAHRPDVVWHVVSKIGDVAAVDWFQRRLFADITPILIGSSEGGSDG